MKKLTIVCLFLVSVMAAQVSSGATLRHRWSFNSSLNDSVGTSHATTSGAVTLGDADIKLQGGYVSLGAGVWPAGAAAPATIELWATQDGTANGWTQIFASGNGTANVLHMGWTIGGNVNSDRIELIGTGGFGAADNTMQPYTLGTKFHVSLRIAPGAGAGGTTRISWAKLDASSGTILKSGYRDCSWTLANLATDWTWLGKGPWADPMALATYDEVRIWDGVLSDEDLTQNVLNGPNQSFSLEVLKIIATTSGTGSGTISPSGTNQVVKGSNPLYSFSPAWNSDLTDVRTNTVSVLSYLVNNTYTFTNLQADCSLEAVFTLKPSTNYFGTVTDPNGNPVANATVVLKLNAGDIPSATTSAQGVTDESGNYSITNIAADYAVSASKTGYMIVANTVAAANPRRDLQFIQATRNIPAMEWLLFAADSADLPVVGGSGNWGLNYCTFDNRTVLTPVYQPAIVAKYGLKWMQGVQNLSSYKLNQADWTQNIPVEGASIVSLVTIGNITNKITDLRDGQSVIVSIFNDSLLLSVYRDGRVFAKRNGSSTASVATYSKDQTVLFSMVVQPSGTFKVFARVLDSVTKTFGDATEIISESAASAFHAFTPGGAWWLQQIQVGSMYGGAVYEGRTYWDGLINDTFVYKGALSDSDRTTLEDDIVAKAETAMSDTWRLTVTTSGSGTADPTGEVLVMKGADQVFTLNPALGWQVGSVTLDGGDPQAITGTAWTNVSVSANGTVHFTFTQVPPKSVTGTVKDSMNQPIAGAKVVLKINTNDLPNATGAYQVTTGADGSYVFPEVVSVNYVVSVSATGYSIQFATLAANLNQMDFVLSRQSRQIPAMEWLLFGAPASGLGTVGSFENWNLLYLDLPGYDKFASAGESIGEASVTNSSLVKWATMKARPDWQWACAYRVHNGRNLAAPIPVYGASAVVLAKVGPSKSAMMLSVFNSEFVMGINGAGQMTVARDNGWQASSQTYAEGETVLFSYMADAAGNMQAWTRKLREDGSFGPSELAINYAGTANFTALNPDMGGLWWLQQINIGNHAGNAQIEGASYWAGGIGDTFVYKTALADGDRALLERDIINDYADRRGAGVMEFDCASGAPLPASVEMDTADMTQFTFSYVSGVMLQKGKIKYVVATAKEGVTLIGVPQLTGLPQSWRLENRDNTILLLYTSGTLISVM